MISVLLRRFAFTQKLEFTPGDALRIPTFRTTDLEGKLLPGAEKYSQALDRPTADKMLKVMLETEQTDLLYYKLQRLNYISFYMQNFSDKGRQK